MKRSKYLLATMFSTTMLISGLGFSNSAKADGFQVLPIKEFKLKSKS